MAPLSGVILPRASANGGFVACVFKAAFFALGRELPIDPELPLLDPLRIFNGIA
jgi:hypothetical protein